MNKTIINLVYPFLAFGFLFIFLNSCKKDEDNNTLNGKTSAVFNPEKTYGTVRDVDGNIYKTITIGTQTWLAENLRVTHYRNGDPIPNVKEKTLWGNLMTGAYCNYNNTTSMDTIATHGRLYNWYAVSDGRNMAPKGWHVPTDDEWTTLINFLEAASIAGGKMKEVGITHWFSENFGATNESGFTAIPCGFRDLDGDFFHIYYSVFLWSSTEYNSTYAWYRYLNNGLSSVGRFSLYFGEKKVGFSVRCIKD